MLVYSTMEALRVVRAGEIKLPVAIITVPMCQCKTAMIASRKFQFSIMVSNALKQSSYCNKKGVHLMQIGTKGYNKFCKKPD